MLRLTRVFTPVLITLLLIFSCDRGSDIQELESDLVDQAQDVSIPGDLGGIFFNGITLPKGTVATVSADGGTLNFTLPEGIKYIAHYSGRVMLAGAGSYTCTSSCSGGCDVVKFGENIGCSACPEGSPESCTGSYGKSAFMVGSGTNGGFIDMRTGVKFSDVRKNSLLTRLPAWEILIQNEKIAAELDKFIETLWGDREIDAQNSKLALVDVYGYQIRMYVPAELASADARVAQAILAGTDVSCSCDSGTEGCTYKAIKKSGFKIGDSCVAGSCTGCTMNF